MKPPLYFTRPAIGAAHLRYFVLGADARTVTRVLASRPDGDEIPEPAAVRFARPAAPSLPHRAPNHALFDLNTGRVCTKCRARKKRDEFRSIGAGHRLASWCKSCLNAHRKERRHAADPAR